MSEIKFTNVEQQGGVDRSLSGVNNALDVLELLTRENRRMSLAEIATALSMSKAGAYCVLTTLANRGYVDWLERGQYIIGLKLWELGSRGSGHNLIEAANPLMEELTRATGESTHLARLSGFDVLFVHSVILPNPVRVHVETGVRQPANWSSTGIIFLAYMSDDELRRVMPTKLTSLSEGTITNRQKLEREIQATKKVGYSLGDGIWRPDVIGVSAPVRYARGRVLAALNLAGPKYRISSNQMKDFIAKTVKAAQAISEAVSSAGK